MKNKYLTGMIKDIFTILKMVHSLSKWFILTTLLKNLFRATFPFIYIIYSYYIIDALVDGQPRAVIMNYVMWLVILNLIVGTLLALFTKLTTELSYRIELKLQAKIADKALQLDYERLESKENLDSLHRAEEGANSHGDITVFCDIFGRLISHIISMVYSLILLSSLFVKSSIQSDSVLFKIFNSPFSACFIVIIFVLSLIVNLRILKKVNDMQYVFFEKNVENNRLFGYYFKLLQNYQLGKDIRIFNMNGMINNEMNRLNDLVTDQMYDFSKSNGKYEGLTSLFNQIVIYLTYAFIGIKAILKIITVGSILKLINSLILLNTSITGIINIFTALDIRRKYFNNYIAFLNLENVKYEGQLPIEKRTDNEYEIEFRNVSFHYPNNDEMVLNNVSMKLKIGEKMAIVGPNGAGKTTFIKLLVRLYDPTEGEILLNGINIKKYDYKEYLDIFSVVFQDFKLFSFDVAQNISTNTVYDEDKIWKVLEQAGIKERVEKMPTKLLTTLYQYEENGVEISGGEAQKLAIARALYKNAPIVILDEPTSALDPISEYEIYSKFDQLVTDKTSIYISHRMSSCRFCDNIVVFENGKVVQTGNHNKLIKEGDGLYAKLWTAQAKYYNL